MSPNPPSLPYGEPGIVTILVLGSFLLLLNVVNYLLDKLVYCGLIGQILIGVAWGQPGAGWLSREVQDAVMQLGYLGLILIVYEGEQIVRTQGSELKLTKPIRWTLHQPQDSACESRSLRLSGPYRHLRAYRALLHPAINPTYHATSSLRGRCSALLDITGYYVHSTVDQWACREPARRRTLERSNDG